MNGMAWFFFLLLVFTNLAWFIAYDRLMHDARRAVMMSGRHPAGTGSSVEEEDEEAPGAWSPH